MEFGVLTFGGQDDSIVGYAKWRWHRNPPRTLWCVDGEKVRKGEGDGDREKEEKIARSRWRRGERGNFKRRRCNPSVLQVPCRLRTWMATSS
jgi:hypothetical protein